MGLRTYFAVIRRNWWIILLSALLGTSGGLAAYLITPARYQSTVDFYVSTPRAEGTSAQAGGQFAESRVNSYILLLSSEKLAQRVISDQNLDMTPRELADQVDASAKLNTVLVTATVTDHSAQRSLRIAEGLAGTFGEMVDELDNQGRTSGATVVINVVSGPTLQAGQVSPDWRQYIGLGLLGGLAIGLLTAFLRELLDTSVRHLEVAQSLVGAPVIGTIAYDPEIKRAPLIIGKESTSVRAEAFRQLRTNLQFIAAARATEVIIVSSSVPLEGKSSTAVNLALTFAQFGERVCLIEGDLRRPRVAEHLDLAREVGLTNVLTGQVALDDALQPWGSDGLSLLASGLTPPNPSELLGSVAMHRVIDSLRGRFDKIVVDTPPVLPVTDAAVASAWADAVVLVVRHGRTTRAQLATAARSLRNVDAPVVGCVFNMRKARRADRKTYGPESYYGTDPQPLELAPGSHRPAELLAPVDAMSAPAAGQRRDASVSSR